MTLQDDILATIQANHGITDAQLVLCHPGPPSRHQQINARCRQLETLGLIVSLKEPGSQIQNDPADTTAGCQTDGPSKQPRRVAPSVNGHPSADVEHPKSQPASAVPATTCSVSLRWHSEGEITLFEDRLKTPPLDGLAGLYRFRFAATRRSYIGESVHLGRRLANYRRPSKEQQTSLRLNDLISKAMADGETILLDVCTDVTVTTTGAPRAADLTSKNMRLFAESAAIMNEDESGWTLLNKAI